MLRTLTLLSAAILATHVSHTAMAQEVSSNDAVQPPASANVESADESNHFQTAFLRRQVNQTMSVGPSNQFNRWSLSARDCGLLWILL